MDDGLDAFRGIMFGMLIGAFMWVLIILTIHYL